MLKFYQWYMTHTHHHLCMTDKITFLYIRWSTACLCKWPKWQFHKRLNTFSTNNAHRLLVKFTGNWYNPFFCFPLINTSRVFASNTLTFWSSNSRITLLRRQNQYTDKRFFAAEGTSKISSNTNFLSPLLTTILPVCEIFICVPLAAETDVPEIFLDFCNNFELLVICANAPVLGYHISGWSSPQVYTVLASIVPRIPLTTSLRLWFGG